MSNIQLVLMMAGLVFAVRIGGLFSGGLRIPETWERALRFTPVAVIAALAASTLTAQASGDLTRLVAAAGAGTVMWLTGRLWLCLLSGFAFYWVLRVLLGL